MIFYLFFCLLCLLTNDVIHLFFQTSQVSLNVLDFPSYLILKLWINVRKFSTTPKILYQDIGEMSDDHSLKDMEIHEIS